MAAVMVTRGLQFSAGGASGHQGHFEFWSAMFDFQPKSKQKQSFKLNLQMGHTYDCKFGLSHLTAQSHLVFLLFSFLAQWALSKTTLSCPSLCFPRGSDINKVINI